MNKYKIQSASWRLLWLICLLPISLLAFAFALLVIVPMHVFKWLYSTLSIAELWLDLNFLRIIRLESMGDFFRAKCKALDDRCVK